MGQQKSSAKEASNHHCAGCRETEYRDTLQRLQAEFENFKKRIEKENEAFRKHAAAEVVKKLLPILDSFEQALKNTADSEKFVKGTELVYAQLYSALEDMGLKKIDALGKPCDPYRHEVLLQEDSDKDGIVLEELQAGYMLNDDVLRCSKVKAGRAKEK
ncbi:nucleotide exchange factor GrpE [Candidatus Woesearchaeota archaeon]|nr:nucleotide exchange factor GrpE [Candidatus Woesearchaeota archaeon]